MTRLAAVQPGRARPSPSKSIPISLTKRTSSNDTPIWTVVKALLSSFAS